MDKLSAEELQSRLRRFTGSEQFYRHERWRNGAVVLTEGAQFLADHAGAYWLIDAIVSWQCKRKVSSEPFQAWTLTRNDDGSAVVSATDGGERVIAHQTILFTDFPLPEITLYFENDTIALPSER